MSPTTYSSCNYEGTYCKLIRKSRTLHILLSLKQRLYFEGTCHWTSNEKRWPRSGYFFGRWLNNYLVFEKIRSKSLDFAGYSIPWPCMASIRLPGSVKLLFHLLKSNKLIQQIFIAQILGVTHNHKLCYFESFDGASIREIVASETDPVHSVDVSMDGSYIVTGGADRQVKVN